MAWWSWILIWSGLVLLLAGTLAWFAFTLFRKLMTAMTALGDLGDQLSILDGAQENLSSERFASAIFQDRDALALVVERARADRAHRRQLRRDQAVRRGKLLQYAPPITQRTDSHA